MDGVADLDGPLGPFNQPNYFQGVIPEDALRTLAARDLKRHFETSGADDESVELNYLTRLWPALLKTLRTTLLPRKHLIAASNAVCVFLENANSAASLAFKEPWNSESTWLTVFEIYLDAFDTGREKAMKQVLDTLINLLQNKRDSYKITQKIVQKLLTVIFLTEPRSHLKASLVTLEALLRRQVIEFGALLLSIDTFMVVQPDWMELRHDSMGPSLFAGNPSATEKSDSLVQNIVSALVLDTLYPEASTGASRLFRSFCKQVFDRRQETGLTFFNASNRSMTYHWTSVVRNLFSRRNLTNLNALATHIFPVFFELDPDGFFLFVEEWRAETTFDVLVRLSALQTGKNLGLVIEEDFVDSSLASHPSTPRICLRNETLGKLIAHSSSEVRLRALALLVTSTASTQPFSPSALSCLIRNLCYVHGDSDPQMRNEIISVIRKMVGRIRGGSSRLAKATGKPANLTFREPDTDSLKEQERFLSWYISFLQKELAPTSSYQRRIFALQALRFLLQSGLDDCVSPSHLSKFGQDEIAWPFRIQILHPSMVKALLALLLDPFEDIRATSHLLLQLCDRPLPVRIAQAQNIARQSRRADHADGLGRLYELLYLDSHHAHEIFVERSAVEAYAVEDMLRELDFTLHDTNTLETSGKVDIPLHGLLLGLKYILTSLSQTKNSTALPIAGLSWLVLCRRVVQICRYVWERVQEPLCQDSPEGLHDDDDLVGGPKDALAYAWRALRDSSLVLQSILSSPFFTNRSCDERADLDDYEGIGNLCFEQLSLLRHRGAFSTVSQTFAMCNRRCAGVDNPDIRDLPRAWYKETLTVIQAQSSKLTRRSAGLPALITGVLGSENDTLFSNVIQGLSGIAGTNVPESIPESTAANLPQVHALNCLKDIFTNKTFSISTEPWLVSTFRLASKCLSSRIWAVQNCGLTLFRALTIRICHVRQECNEQIVSERLQEDRVVPPDRYADVFELIQELINFDSSSKMDGKVENVNPSSSLPPERVSAALDLIIRMNESTIYRERLQRIVKSFLGEPIWAVRDNAARTFSALVAPRNALQVLKDLGNLEGSSQNAKHGHLLCMKYIFQKTLWKYTSFALGPFIALIDAVLLEHATSLSPIAMSAAIELANDILSAALRSGEPVEMAFACDKELWKLLNGLAQDTVGDQKLPVQALFEAPLREALAFANLLITVAQTASSSSDLVSLFSLLLEIDSNAACAALQRVKSMATFLNPGRLAALCIALIHSSKLFEVRAIAMQTLVVLSESELGMSQLANNCTTLMGCRFKECAEATQELLNAWMRLEGVLVGNYHSKLSNADLDVRFHRFYEWLEAVREGFNGLDPSNRLVAVESLLGFKPAMLDAVNQSHDLLPVYLLLYDSLNDDDEEIRYIGASIVSSIASVSEIDDGAESCGELCPLAASHWLVDYLIEHFGRSRELVVAGLQRMLCQSKERIESLEFEPMEALLESSFSNDNNAKIFVEEEQNLYIDYVREAALWASILRKTTDDAHSGFVSALRRWSTNATASLAEHKERIETPFTPNIQVLVNLARAIEAANLVQDWS